jgi:peptidoglycan/xylan/chitin deacetylase (PgdA/CDA1 family)
VKEALEMLMFQTDRFEHMLSTRTKFIKAGLEGCYLSGAHHFAKTFLGGLGAILTLHHVRPSHDGEFQPNRLLEITPDFLESVIVRLRAEGFDIVNLDEATRRMNEPGKHNKFIVLTFDDGYRDILTYAYPLLKKHNCPFTVYIPTAFPDGEGLLWWRALEHVIVERSVVTIETEGEPRIYLTGSTEEKYEAFRDLYWWARTLDDKSLRQFMRNFCASFHFDMKEACRKDCMNWQEIAILASDPLVTIGAHTVDHPNLSKVDKSELLSQIREGVRILEAALGKRPEHFSYPYGSLDAAGLREFEITRELGFSTAVTTRPGILYEEHTNHLHALPRVSLNGDYQAVRYLDVMLSGLPFYVWNGFERISVA